jgi:hypothetical protein
MSCYLMDWMLLAQSSRLRGMGSKFRGNDARLDLYDLFIAIGIMLSIVIGVWMLTRVLARQDGHRRLNSPRRLFRELCQAHELDFSSRRFLNKVARHQRLRHKARLFVEPERLKPSNLSPQLRSRKRLLKALRQRLYEGLQEMPTPAV